MESIAEYVLGWNLPALLCLLAGVILLIVEMFTPGFGVPGGLGIAALIGAVVLRADTFKNAIITLAVVLILLLVCGIFFLRSFQKGKLSRSPIVLSDEIRGGSSSLTPETAQALLGKTGIVLNPLHPAGAAEFDGERLDVISAGEFIEKGRTVRIDKIEGVRILVSEVRI